MLHGIDAIILGAIEGLTEFLPISSTAHLMVGATILGIPQTSFVKTFEIAVQLGAIVAVFAYFRNSLRSYISLLPKIITAFIPTAIVGYLLYSLIKTYLVGNLLIIPVTLILGGVIMIVFEKKKNIVPSKGDAVGEIRSMKTSTAVTIGLAQSLAIVPGVSRSAATIIAGLSRGLSREAIVLFTFLLGAPTLLAATLYDLYKTGGELQSGEFSLLAIGFITALIFAYISVGFMIRLVSRIGFAPFGWYRIMLGVLLILILVV